MTVALIGATGTVGPDIVRSLQARKAKVRVLTRDAARATAVLGGEVELQQLDILDDEAVRAATADASALLVLTSHAHDMTDVQLRIIRALRRRRVKIVKLSGTSSCINPDGPYTCRQHWEVEEVRRGTPAWEAEHFEEMYEMFRRGESEFVSTGVATLAGHPPRPVEAYVAELAFDPALAQLKQRAAEVRT